MTLLKPNSLTHKPHNKRVIRALFKKNVQFVVIGGLAVRFYNPNRIVGDIDILVRSTPNNIERLKRALSSLKLPTNRVRDLAQPNKICNISGKYDVSLFSSSSDIDYLVIRKQTVRGYLFDIPVKLPQKNMLLKLLNDGLKANEHTGNESKLNKLRKDIQFLSDLN